MSCHQWVKPSLLSCIRSSWNVYNKGVLFPYINVRPHVAQMTRDTIGRLGLETLCFPRYSPGLAPTDYRLRGKSFANETELRQTLTDFFAFKTPDSYRKGISQLEARWQKVQKTDGNSFEV